MSTAARDLVTVLAAGMSIPVRPPGSNIGTLPCLAVRPADDRIESARYVVRGFVVSVLVARSGAVEQLDRLEQLSEETIRVLDETGYRLGNPLRYVADDTDGVAWLAREIPVTVDGEVLC